MLGRLGQYGLLVPDLSIAVYSMLIDGEWLALLPEDLKTVISQCVEEISMRQWRFSKKKTQEAFQKIRNEFGAEIFVVTEDEIPQWVVKTSPSYKRFSNKYPKTYKNFVGLHEMHGHKWPPAF
jgi:TRAP-type C4-dicarboxylate transport system substrate-binding protein